MWGACGCGCGGVHNVYCWAIQADETVKLTYEGYTRAVCVLHA